jgi:glutathione S-transferase
MEAVQCDILDEAIRDAEQALGNLFWDKQFATKATSFKQIELPATLNNFELYLGTIVRDGTYCVGNSLTFVDFVLWNYLDMVRAFSNDILLQFSTLCQIKIAVETRPRIHAYLKSVRRPATITVSKASFGGTPETS